MRVSWEASWAVGPCPAGWSAERVCVRAIVACAWCHWCVEKGRGKYVPAEREGGMRAARSPPPPLLLSLNLPSTCPSHNTKLGEGGFAYVYAVCPADEDGPATASSAPTLALKRTLGPDPDRLAAAGREAAAAGDAAAAGPCTLALLAAGRDGAAFHLLTPLAAGGTLADAVAARRDARLACAGYRLDGPVPSARLAAAAGALPPCLALALFAQAAEGVATVHAAGLVHCDVKPQNLLLMEGGGLSLEDGAGEGRAAPSSGGGRAASEDNDEDAASAASLRASGAGSSRPPSAATAGATGSHAGPFPTLVLADFGSARPAPLPIPTHPAGLALVEWADAHTSPAYRPPELYDPPSGAGAALTTAVDVWGLGCVLYFLLAGGVSPFERVAGAAGGSLALAVLAGSVAWPDQGGFGAGAAVSGGGGKPNALPPPRRVAAARALAEACLAPNPADRPAAAEVAARARTLAR